MNVPKLVTAAIIVREGKVFIARRAAGQRQAGKWEFPGGKVDPGETERECLRRELREELGVETEVGRKAGESTFAYEHGSVRLVAFEARIVSGDLRLSVHDGCAWVDPEDLLSYDLAPADIPLARQLLKR